MFERGSTFRIGSATVVPIPISHPNTGKGYKFIEDGKTFVFITDNELGFVHPGGLPFEDYVEFCSGADLLIHDGEYTAAEYPRLTEWGHSSYTDALELAFQAGVKRLGLFHLNQERSDDQIDRIVDVFPEHQQAQIRAQLGVLRADAVDPGPGSAGPAARLAKSVIEMVYKENKILLPLALQTLTHQEWKSVREGEDELDVQYEGEELEIGFNANYLLEVLRYMPTDEVKLTFRAPERAATLEPVSSDDADGMDYLCLVMPLRLLD